MDIAITPTGNYAIDGLLAIGKMLIYPGAVGALAGLGFGARALLRKGGLL